MIVSPVPLLLQFVESIYADSALGEVATRLANLAYKPEYVTTVVWSSNESEDATDFLKRFYGSVVTNELQKNNNHNNRLLNKAVGYKQTVLFVNSVEEFAYFITSVNLDLIIPIRLILIITTFVEDLSVVTQTAWKNDVGDIIIVNENRSGNISLTTYFPYGSGVCGDYTPVALKINTEKLFPIKFRSFYGCPIKFSLTEFPPYLELEITNDTTPKINGTDGRIMLEVLEMLNATIDIVAIEKRESVGNSTLSKGITMGGFDYMVSKKADILLPAAIMTSKRYDVAQISQVYDTLDIHWCGPSRRIILTWAKVLLPFFDFVTVYVVVTYAVFAVIVTVAKKSSMHQIKTKDNIIYQGYVILMGQVLEFETKSYLVNYLFMLWLWFCFIYRVVYQCDLIQRMHQTIEEAAMGTLENAVKFVDGFGGVETLASYYNGTPFAEQFQRLPVHDLGPLIQAIGQGKRFLVLVDVLLVHVYDANVQILDEPVSRAATCIFLRPGWPAAEEVDSGIQRIVEVGLADRILEDYYKWDKQFGRADQDELKGLDFLTLSACFYFLVVMWILTSIIFVIELTYHNIQTKNRYKNKKMPSSSNKII